MLYFVKRDTNEQADDVVKREVCDKVEQRIAEVHQGMF